MSREIVELLNQDLSGEIEAILTYMRNAYVTDSCPPSRLMEEVAKEEMRHVEWLSELIVDLGGTPSMEHRALNFGGKEIESRLKRLIGLEGEAISMYEAHIGMVKNAEVVRKLRRILEDELEHLKEFEGQLKELEK